MRTDNIRSIPFIDNKLLLFLSIVLKCRVTLATNESFLLAVFAFISVVAMTTSGIFRDKRDTRLLCESIPMQKTFEEMLIRSQYIKRTLTNLKNLFKIVASFKCHTSEVECRNLIVKQFIDRLKCSVIYFDQLRSILVEKIVISLFFGKHLSHVD